MRPHGFAYGESENLAFIRYLALEFALEVIPGKPLVVRFKFLVIQSARLGLAKQICDPGGDRLHNHLRSLALQESEDVEIAVALGDRGPELTGDLHHRLYLG